MEQSCCWYGSVVVVLDCDTGSGDLGSGFECDVVDGYLGELFL